MKIQSLTLLCLLTFISSIAQAQLNVDFTITPESGQSSISPLVYGCNWTENSNMTTGQNYSFVRMGGNRATAYNWENNASNAGSDWQNSSDDFWANYLGITTSDVPGIAATTIVDEAKNNNGEALITLQMAGYVSADKDGTVTTTAPNSRWYEAVPAKGSAFSLTPDLTDDKVYMDEFVNFLTDKYGTGGVKYSLDNEPALWSHTHSLIHPDSVTCQELVSRSTELASAVKAVDASAEIFGFVSYGFYSFMALQDAPDWGDLSSSYSWFIDYYLEKMKEASDAAGKRLIDVLDLHWYPEATGDNRITSAGANTTKDKLARLQAPRTLWDPDYIENSWIAQYFDSYLPIITRVENSINAYYPGTKLAITEFNYGGFEDITGALALTDVLGIFGKYGVYASTHWDDPGTYGSLAYKLYRNYDGNNATYGDMNVGATMSDKENSSVYASVVSGSTDEIHIIAINKNMDSAISGTFTIAGTDESYSSASVYAINDGTTNIIQESEITFTGNSFTYTLPALSAYHFIVKKGGEFVPVTGVDVTPESDSVSEYETINLAAVFTPENATNKGVTWSSNDNTIATVSQTGVVTGVSAGTVTITATTEESGYTATATVTVLPFVPPCDNPVSTALPLTVEGVGEYCYVTNGSINFVNSWNADLIEINGVDYTNTYSNTLPEKIYGQYFIHYVSSVSYSHFEIDGTGGDITEVPVTGVSVTPTNTSVNKGSTTPLTATISPANATNKSVSWSSDNASVATVSTTGLITGISEGTTTITVTTADGGFTASGEVTVNNDTTNISVTGVAISPTSSSVKKGSTTSLAATISPENATNQGVNWSSDNTDVATVDPAGIVSGISKGTATITVTTNDGGFTASSAITVMVNTDTICDNPVTVSLPFSQDGIGEYCFVTSDSISYINSWNTDLVEVNGADYTNTWSNNYPAPINGNYYIHYIASVSWAHMELSSVKSAEELAPVSADELIIFPNPVIDQVNIVLPNTLEPGSLLKVFDNAGKIIKSVNVEGKTFDLDMSSYDKGIYSVVVYGNNKTLKKTFIK
jgi:uncharacterized protein YjdB